MCNLCKISESRHHRYCGNHLQEALPDTENPLRGKNPDYTPGQAFDDYNRLMNAVTLMQIDEKTGSPRYAELRMTIPVQVKLTMAKLDDHPHLRQAGQPESQYRQGRLTRLVISLLLLLIQSVALADSITGRVARVTDGDTIVVLDASNAQHKIRLQGMDAPERAKPSGRNPKSTCPT